MSERKLSITLRIKIIDQIADIDLPGFLFEQIDSSLNELNYFKLSNLFDNIKEYKDYLTQLGDVYTKELKRIQKSSTTSHAHRSINYEPFMTNALFNEGFLLTVGKKELLGLQSTYCVSCILTMKEYINRRILQTSRLKQKTMTSVTV